MKLGVLVILVWGLVACNETAVIPLEEWDYECGDPPTMLYAQLLFTGDGTGDWSGVCGPETITMVYEDSEYKWVNDSEGEAVSCESSDTIAIIEWSEAALTGSVYDWCWKGGINLEGVVTFIEDGQSIATCDYALNTAFWHPSDSSGASYAGADLDRSDTAFSEIGCPGVFAQAMRPY